MTALLLAALLAVPNDTATAAVRVSLTIESAERLTATTTVLDEERDAVRVADEKPDQKRGKADVQDEPAHDPKTGEVADPESMPDWDAPGAAQQ